MIWFACRWVVVVPYSNESSKHGTRWPIWSSFFPLFFAKEAEKNHVRTFDVLFWDWEACHLHFSTSSIFRGNENGWCFWKLPKWMIAIGKHMVWPDAQCTRESYVRVGPAWSFWHANSKNRMWRAYSYMHAPMDTLVGPWSITRSLASSLLPTLLLRTYTIRLSR
jgi:hypothetical protein